MKRVYIALVAVIFFSVISCTEELKCDLSNGEEMQLTLPDGTNVEYTAYTHLYYVTNVEDSTYQYLNLFVPRGATSRTPIFMRNYVGGFLAGDPRMPYERDASGRALAEGYVVVIPGARGSDSKVKGKDDSDIYTGRAPMAILDLKAVVRYLRHFDGIIPGDSEKIISDGTSAGGAMSSLLGASANNKLYEPYLKRMGAAREKDNIFAAVCFCPIIDLDHADMEYEWLYGETDAEQRLYSDCLKRVSAELKNQFPSYLESLGLTTPEGATLTVDNYSDYVCRLLMESAQEGMDAGHSMPPCISIEDGRVVGIDLPEYLRYVDSQVRLKTCPAFDRLGVAEGDESFENNLFGDASGTCANFTDYALQQAEGDASARISEQMQKRVLMMNPMGFIVPGSSNVAPHWYIRHGSRDRDTSFPVPINLATKLDNAGYDVDFKLPWDRAHEGDYDLDELFFWLRSLQK